ncbi:MAG: hypothetical protein NC039_02100 [Muribaculaceae bacterium]|nr:hypothetical protein [Muribaculaceae bacterium]
MIFALSNTVICDTVRSLAAFRSLTSDRPEHDLLAPILDSSRRGILINIVRQSFSEIVLRLLPFTTDFTLGSENSSSSPPATPAEGPSESDIMKVELRLPAGLPAGAGWSLRRALEQAVAMTALSRLVAATDSETSAGWHLAENFSQQAETALKEVNRSLSSDPTDLHPFLRE